VKRKSSRGPSGSDLREAAERIHSASIHLLRWLRTADQESGLGPARLSALSVLVFGGARTLGELAEAEQVKPPTMSRVVDALVDEGLARRKPSPEDRRRVIVAATPRGRRAMEAARSARLDRLVERARGLSARDVEALRRTARILERLARGDE